MDPFNLKNQICLQFSDIFFYCFPITPPSIPFSPSGTPMTPWQVPWIRSPRPSLMDSVSHFNSLFPFLFIIVLGCEAFLLLDLPNHQFQFLN